MSYGLKNRENPNLPPIPFFYLEEGRFEDSSDDYSQPLLCVLPWVYTKCLQDYPIGDVSSGLSRRTRPKGTSRGKTTTWMGEYYLILNKCFTWSYEWL